MIPYIIFFKKIDIKIKINMKIKTSHITFSLFAELNDLLQITTHRQPFFRVLFQKPFLLWEKPEKNTQENLPKKISLEIKLCSK